jgi:hypothetical protein
MSDSRRTQITKAQKKATMDAINNNSEKIMGFLDPKSAGDLMSTSHFFNKMLDDKKGSVLHGKKTSSLLKSKETLLKEVKNLIDLKPTPGSKVFQEQCTTNIICDTLIFKPILSCVTGALGAISMGFLVMPITAWMKDPACWGKVVGITTGSWGSLVCVGTTSYSCYQGFVAPYLYNKKLKELKPARLFDIVDKRLKALGNVAPENKAASDEKTSLLEPPVLSYHPYRP